MELGQVHALIEEEGSCTTYKVRLEAYFHPQEVTYKAKKRARVVLALPNGAAEALHRQCNSKSINDLTYTDVIKDLGSHYKP
ncbi:hypothetical protein HPB50_021216 [Hyalomma asiaticum]|uniref:Uncharacterized protein n=1 Tax=Hyalomma asiaticum TaxID=266040 RepID=A0ACB7TAY0_HYAAI|nr:hypothetical protein HPB50_021216 [Hyalomma asiaticum]